MCTFLYYLQEDERRSERSHRPEVENFEEGSEEDEYTDADDFIVDDDGRPIAEKRKKKKPIFTDAYVEYLNIILDIIYNYSIILYTYMCVITFYVDITIFLLSYN